MWIFIDDNSDGASGENGSYAYKSITCLPYFDSLDKWEKSDILLCMEWD